MSKGGSFGKSLKGIGSLSAKLLGPIQNSIESAIASGGVELTNVQISGGTIDGVVIGDGQPGPGSFTTIKSGSAQGQGYSVCFYGTRVGDEACWEPSLGLWDINGDLSVRDISDLGNLRISGNTISATNSGGSINLIPSSPGTLAIFSGITQTTANQDIIFNTGLGNFSAAANTYNAVSNNLLNLRTKQGDISIDAGYAPTISNITLIPVASPGGIATVTTSSAHFYSPGSRIKLTTPGGIVDGYYTVLTAPTLNTFTVQLPTGIPVSSTISSGTTEIESDINLTAKDFINVSVDTKVAFGGKQYISGDSLGNFYIQPAANKNIIIPDSSYIQLSNTDLSKKIGSDGTNLIINPGTGSVQVSGDLTVLGTTTYIKSTTLSVTDPVINTGGSDTLVVDDLKDRGISSKYFTAGTERTSFFGRSAATGCFTYIPNATNTNEVFTGTPGCARFGNVSASSISASSINVGGGTLTDACNITCPDDMTITGGTSISLLTPSLSTTSSLINITAPPSATDRGVTFLYNDSGTKSGFYGWDTSANAFTFLTNTTNTAGVITGTPAPISSGSTVITGNLQVTGTITGTLSGSANTIERLSISTSVPGNPNANRNITFVNVSGTGTVSSTLLAPATDGFLKFISINTLPSGTIYQIVCPAGILLDPGSGTTATKTLRFDTQGQSAHLIWDNVKLLYTIVNAGCYIV